MKDTTQVITNYTKKYENYKDLESLSTKSEEEIAQLH